jgi:hypothetical protein
MFTLLAAFSKNAFYARFFVRSYANLAVNTKVNTQTTNTTSKSGEVDKEERSSGTITSITPGEYNVKFD